MTFSNAYQASFSDQRVFPFLKRATATGICNFISRGLTIFAPLAAELDTPIPTSILLGISVVAFIVAFFLPSKSFQDQQDKEILEQFKKEAAGSDQMSDK